jgi:hypothetical protein
MSTPIMMRSGRVSKGFSSRRGTSPEWLRLVVLAAAVAAVLFVATGAALWHQDTPGTVCSICYAAHIPALRGAPLRTPVASYAVVWLVPADLLLDHAAPETLSSAPRGPPA